MEPDLFAGYFALGLSMSAAIACLFCVITLLCGDQTRAVVWCMGISFGMLFLSLHTNQILVQTRYKNGALNPHYVEGAKRVLYGILHDLNPCGQAAQLSCWEVLEPIRAVPLQWAVDPGNSGCRNRSVSKKRYKVRGILWSFHS